MKFAKYAEHIRQLGHFSVQLNDHRGQTGLTDGICEIVTEKWVYPLLALSQGAYIYRKVSKDRPYDATPPPRSVKPAVLSKTPVRTELDPKSVLGREYFQYWAWALRHANVTLCVGSRNFPVEALAKECWDPTILLNLGAVVAGGAIQLAKRQTVKKHVCCVFSHDSYSIDCHIFAPPEDLLAYYECFVMNCHFILKGLERDLLPLRRKRRGINNP